jgi:hypothetical protein
MFSLFLPFNSFRKEIIAQKYPKIRDNLNGGEPICMNLHKTNYLTTYLTNVYIMYIVLKSSFYERICITLGKCME